jgi:hypothetical protein
MKATAAATNDMLGYSVAISGNYVVAGAPLHASIFYEYQGAAYVFVKPADGWVNSTQKIELIATDGRGGDELGWSIAMSGKTAVAGATQNISGGPGAAYVFGKSNKKLP